jgi:phosphopantothenoylcysteine decarboxylase/phosphopantothenate--cysteine ligase
VKCPDVLAAVSGLARRPFAVDFAAETEKLEEHALAKLQEKSLDMIIANQVGENLGFDRDDNSALVLWPGGRRALGRASKQALAREIVGLVAERYAGTKSAATLLRRPRAS